MNQQAEWEENNPLGFNQCNTISDSGKAAFKEQYSGDQQTKTGCEFGVEGGAVERREVTLEGSAERSQERALKAMRRKSNLSRGQRELSDSGVACLGFRKNAPATAWRKGWRRDRRTGGQLAGCCTTAGER